MDSDNASTQAELWIYVNKGSMTAIGVLFPVFTVLAFSVRASGWRQFSGKLEIDDFLIIPAAVSCWTDSVSTWVNDKVTDNKASF